MQSNYAKLVAFLTEEMGHPERWEHNIPFNQLVHKRSGELFAVGPVGWMFGFQRFELVPDGWPTMYHSIKHAVGAMETEKRAAVALQQLGVA